MINILIADDHEMIRKGISALLKDQPGISIIGTASNGQQAVDFCSNNPVNVVLMDLQMPVMSGIEATAAIVSKNPNTRVLAVTINEETSFIMEVLNAGATGYIMKHSTGEKIVQAIKDVSEGKKHFSADVLSKMSSQFRIGGTTLARDPHKVTITNKEQEVLNLLVMERTNQEIAEQLDCSVRTVDTHRRNIIKKLGVRNIVGLTKYALKHGLV